MLNKKQLFDAMWGDTRRQCKDAMKKRKSDFQFILSLRNRVEDTTRQDKANGVTVNNRNINELMKNTKSH